MEVEPRRFPKHAPCSNKRQEKATSAAVTETFFQRPKKSPNLPQPAPTRELQWRTDMVLVDPPGQFVVLQKTTEKGQGKGKKSRIERAREVP